MFDFTDAVTELIAVSVSSFNLSLIVLMNPSTIPAGAAGAGVGLGGDAASLALNDGSRRGRQAPDDAAEQRRDADRRPWILPHVRGDVECILHRFAHGDRCRLHRVASHFRRMPFGVRRAVEQRDRSDHRGDDPVRLRRTVQRELFDEARNFDADRFAELIDDLAARGLLAEYQPRDREQQRRQRG